MNLFILTFMACVQMNLWFGERALHSGNLVEAETRYRQALGREPGNAEALYGLGWTYHLAGESQSARTAFQTCVDLNPESPLGYKGLGSVAMAEGNSNLARKRFEEALSHAPGDPAIRQSLALLDLSLGQTEAALQAFTKLSEEFPDQSEYHQGRAESLLILEKFSDALTTSARAVETASTPRARAMALLIRARVLIAATSDRVDPAKCAETAPPVYAWLDEAERVLDEAEATGMEIPDLPETRRSVRRRRGAVDDTCPGVRVSTP